MGRYRERNKKMNKRRVGKMNKGLCNRLCRAGKRVDGTRNNMEWTMTCMGCNKPSNGNRKKDI